MRTRNIELHRKVLFELESIADLSEQEIGISVHAGVVTLSGRTDTYEHKFVVEQTVARIPGVKAVAVDLRVGRSGSQDLTDTEIAHAIADILQWSLNGLRKRMIGKVERGWVTLMGEVDFERLELPETLKRAIIVHRGELTPDYGHLRRFLVS